MGLFLLNVLRKPSKTLCDLSAFSCSLTSPCICLTSLSLPSIRLSIVIPLSCKRLHIRSWNAIPLLSLSNFHTKSLLNCFCSANCIISFSAGILCMYASKSHSFSSALTECFSSITFITSSLSSWHFFVSSLICWSLVTCSVVETLASITVRIGMTVVCFVI